MRVANFFFRVLSDHHAPLTLHQLVQRLRAGEVVLLCRREDGQAVQRMLFRPKQGGFSLQGNIYVANEPARSLEGLLQKLSHPQEHSEVRWFDGERFYSFLEAPTLLAMR